MLAQHFRGSPSNISWAKRTYVFTGRSSHPASPGGGRRRAPLRERKKRRRTLYVTGILSRVQEMALIFDGFLPVTKRKRARARHPLVPFASHLGAFVLGVRRDALDMRPQNAEFRRLSRCPRPEAGNRGRERRVPIRDRRCLIPALNAMFERAIPGA